MRLACPIRDKADFCLGFVRVLARPSSFCYNGHIFAYDDASAGRSPALVECRGECLAPAYAAVAAAAAAAPAGAYDAAAAAAADGAADAAAEPADFQR